MSADVIAAKLVRIEQLGDFVVRGRHSRTWRLSSLERIPYSSNLRSFIQHKKGSRTSVLLPFLC